MAGGSGPEGSLGKLSTSVTGRRLGEFVVALLGPDALLIDGYDGSSEPAARAAFVTQHALVSSPATGIAGGTDQIQRNIIGDRVLGLPREPAVDRGVPWNETLRN
jgi:alkylation response protein AidB-like acyl-CoA dehydrogenase